MLSNASDLEILWAHIDDLLENLNSEEKNIQTALDLQSDLVQRLALLDNHSLQATSPSTSLSAQSDLLKRDLAECLSKVKNGDSDEGTMNEVKSIKKRLLDVNLKLLQTMSKKHLQ